MRIGIFSESYEPVRNGVATSITTLKDELERQGHEVFVSAPSYPGHVDTDTRVIRFPSMRTWCAPDYPLAIPYIRGFADRVSRLELDVIHTHTPFMLGGLGLKLAKRLRIPVVSTNHTQYTAYAHYFPLLPVATTRSVIVRHMRNYYSQCDSVVVPSAPIEEALRQYGVQTPIHVIPTGNSLDTSRDEDARRRIRDAYGISDDALVLMYVGRLAREKNLGLVLNAFERIARKHPKARLMIVGGGPFEAGCRNMGSALECSDRVIFTGSKPRAEVAKYYSAGDLFVFPSTTETQGLVICEALRAGLPAVVVRAGGSPEMVIDGEDSLLAENDLDDFTEKIDRLLSNPCDMALFSARAVQNSARFSPREMVLRMLQVYESVLSAGRRGAPGKVLSA